MLLSFNIFLHIKPGNLLLATDGILKISDFGVAEVILICIIFFPAHSLTILFFTKVEVEVNIGDCTPRSDMTALHFPWWFEKSTV